MSRHDTLTMSNLAKAIGTKIHISRSSLCFLLVFSSLILTGCITNHPRSGSFEGDEDFTPATAYREIQSEYRYELQAGDVLHLEFVKDLENGRNLTIQPDGWINPPYLESMSVAGLTLSELELKLESAYAEVLRFNDIQLDLLSAQPLYIYVGGEVVSAGKQSFSARTTVQQAILTAGGATKRATPKQAFVVRDTGESKPSYLVFDFQSDDAPVYHDIYLQPKDIVIVPRRPISQVALFIDLYINEILPFSRSVNVTYYFDETNPNVPRN